MRLPLLITLTPTSCPPPSPLLQGADPWAADRCGKRTALHYACIKGHALCVRALLDNLPPEHAKKQGIRWAACVMGRSHQVGSLHHAGRLQSAFLWSWWQR